MGDLRKRLSWARLAVLCFTALVCVMTLSLGAVCVGNNMGLQLQDAATGDDVPDFLWTREGIRAAGFENINTTTKELRITTPEELALFNYQITEGAAGAEDYSGWTITLLGDLDMGVPDEKYHKVLYWTPIMAGRDGRHTNFVFDGGGHTIRNLKLMLTDDTTLTAGLFGSLVGGAVQNLTLEGLSFRYDYSGTAIAGATMPIEVAVGGVAGTAAGTTINNVYIKNSAITLNANNVNGHNFYVGTAVGKLTNYQDADGATVMGRVDTVDVLGGETYLNITNNAAGIATQGYLGGLVGQNVSGMILNCKVKELNVSGSFNQAAGSYYVGGLVGETVLRVKDERSIVVSGLINNIVIVNDVNVSGANGEYSVDTKDYTMVGLIAGRVYFNWVHSNIYIGQSSRELFGTGKVFNSNNVIFYVHADECAISHNAANDYYVEADGSPFARCGLNSSITPGYVSCSIHSTLVAPSPFTEVANEDNYKFTDFDEANAGLDIDYLSDFETTAGALYKVAQPIIKYQYGGDADHLRDAVNQFRVWLVDKETQEPYFGDYYGLDYDVIFNANGGGWYDENGDGTTTLVKKYKYHEEVDALSTTELPTKTGYNFAGWDKNISPATLENPWKFKGEADADKIETEAVTLYAKWQVASYTVTFMTEDKDGNPEEFTTKSVEYGAGIPNPNDGNPDNDPVALGKEFLGWFTYANFSGGKEQAEAERWQFGQAGAANGYVMPGDAFTLYAGWFDIYGELREVLTRAQTYLNDKQYYTVVTSGALEKECTVAMGIMGNDPQYKDESPSAVKERLEVAIAGLRVDLTKLTELEAYTKAGTVQQYAFTYTLESYTDYQSIFGNVRGYVEGFNDEVAKNVEDLKSWLNKLETSYQNLVTNPNLVNEAGVIDENTINKLKADYDELNHKIDNIAREDYTAASWSIYSRALADYRDAFAAENPYLEDLQNAVLQLQSAQSGLVQAAGVTDPGENPGKDDPKQDPAVKSLPISPIVIGIIITGVMLLGAGGLIGFDLYRNVYLKKKATKEAAIVTPTEKEEPEDEDMYV